MNRIVQIAIENRCRYARLDSKKRCKEIIVGSIPVDDLLTH